MQKCIKNHQTTKNANEVNLVKLRKYSVKTTKLLKK